VRSYIADLNAKVLVVPLECAAGELGPIVGDDPVRNPKSTDDWIEPGEKVIFGPGLVEDAEANVRCIQDNLRATKSHQETYATRGINLWNLK
jgi:hypothetical protein